VGISEVLHEGKKVKEYTILALLATLAVVITDRLLGTRVLRTKTFRVFIIVMCGCTFLVNGYLTWRPIVLYNEAYFMNMRLLTIPVEDFFFGFSVVTLSVVLWEYYKNKGRKTSETSAQRDTS
jgi:lycopene cyclase domain-containing protein